MLGGIIMEKTNELNKFLSYIHMGNTIFRIYHEQAEKQGNHKLVALIIEIKEIFKTHEEAITKLIEEFDEEATNELSFAGVMGVYKERLKTFPDELSICTSAIKATYMGLISALKFLDENKELSTGIKEHIIKVIDDYGIIANKIKEFVLEQYR